MELIKKARKLAERAHREQVRKTDGTPYIHHPVAVAEIVEKYGFAEAAVAAALVHDVLEDTEVSESELRAELGDEVVDIVTAVSEDKNLPWEQRKEKYVVAVATADENVKAVSVADKIHNAKSLIAGYAEQGSVIWKKFNRGKKEKLWFENLLLSELKKTWQHSLLEEYASQLAALESLPD